MSRILTSSFVDHGPSPISDAPDLSPSLDNARAFSMSTEEFKRTREMILKLTGISMGENKRQMIYRRLSTQLAAGGYRSFNAYLDAVQSGENALVEAFRNALTTNLTSFFRESHHFDMLATMLLPDLMKRRRASRRLRIWVSACSTGEEPYSIAITLLDAFPELANWDVKIQCTDIDTDVLAAAEQGVYQFERVEQVSMEIKKRWFQKGTGSAADLVRVKPELKKLLEFQQLNLVGDWPKWQPFDVIFCRNTLIYFDPPTQRRLIERFSNLLGVDDYLILGHSEAIQDMTPNLKLVGKTVYRRV